MYIHMIPILFYQNIRNDFIVAVVFCVNDITMSNEYY